MIARSAILLVLALLWVGAVDAQPTVTTDSLYSAALGRMTTYMVLLPPNMTEGAQYPVLYLLHGVMGGYRDWVSRTRLLDYAAAYQVIIAMPDAGDSWYVNSATNPNDAYEDYVMRDFTIKVERQYPVDQRRRAIAGLSMGGYGAIMYGLRYTGRFRLVGGFSSAITFPADLDSINRYPASAVLEQSLRAAFGANTKNIRPDYDVFNLASSATQADAPYIFLAAGVQDAYTSFLPAHRKLAEILERRGIPYEYHEMPGGHDWTFWDRAIRAFLQLMNDRLQMQPR